MKAETKKDQNVNSKTNPSLKFFSKLRDLSVSYSQNKTKWHVNFLVKKTFKALIERKHISFVCFERLLGLGEENKNR
jgi:hypothetical protein